MADKDDDNTNIYNKVQKRFKELTNGNTTGEIKRTIDQILHGDGKKVRTGVIQKCIEFSKKYDVKTTFIIINVVIVVFTIFYVNRKFRLNTLNCSRLRKIYSDNKPKILSINENNPYKLRDFYIKTAYNCCCGGQFKNDYVNLCAMDACIQQGARCLDFEIYSLDNKPVVATSSINDFTVKEVYNQIPMGDVLRRINEVAFSSGSCPNYKDPLFLHFRIMSNNCTIYNELAKMIENNPVFNNRTLGPKYSHENHGYNLGQVDICKLRGKIIIMVDASNPLYQHTALDEYVNIASGSIFMKLLRYKDVKFTQDLSLEEFNKKQMSLVIPDLSPHNRNLNFNVARLYGCQFIGMCFQNYDGELQNYNEFFDSEKTAFVLKPERLRFVPVTIKAPRNNPRSWSWAPLKFGTDYYSYTI